MGVTTILPPNILKCMDKESRIPLGKAGVTNAEAQQKADLKREKELHGRIESLLRLRGIVYGHARMDRKSTYTKGWPDFTFAIKGTPIAVECKVGDNRLNADQVDVGLKMEANGWHNYVVHDENEFMKVLNDYEA